MAAAPPQVVNLPADYSTDRLGQSPVAIILHGTGGTDSRGTLQHGDGRGVSIHALIGKPGLIYRMVPDERGANHAGAPTSSFTLNGKTYTGGAVNRVTMGVELENRQDGKDMYPDAQLLSMGWEINRIRAKYGYLPIFRHATLDPTRRRDPYQLSVEEIEKWANAAALVYDPHPPAPKRYKVLGTPIHEAPDVKSDVALGGKAMLAPGTVITPDQVKDGWAHIPEGFIDVKSLEAL